MNLTDNDGWGLYQKALRVVTDLKTPEQKDIAKKWLYLAEKACSNSSAREAIWIMRFCLQYGQKPIRPPERMIRGEQSES